MELEAKRWQLVLKRLTDLIGGTVLMILISPVLLVVSLAIKLESPGPVFFRQERLGLKGKVFRIFKFRSMVQNAEQLMPGVTAHRRDPRITRVGHFLRKYRLDEFPQLFNVIRGEMSLVGPRPLLPEYLEHYAESDHKRMLLPPGMTGWQQIKGGSTNTWEERVALDVWYVEHWNFLLDLLILLRTPLVVLKADTVYGQDGWQRSGAPPDALFVADSEADPTPPDQEVHR